MTPFGPRTPFTALLAAGTLAGGAAAQIVVDPATNVGLGAGAQPSGLAAGDFDGDGDMDLATTIDPGDDVLVLLGDGAGGYVVGPASALPASSSPQDLIAGDFNGDMIMDLAVAVRDPVGTVITMIGNGNGTFTMGPSATVGDRPRGLSAADIDGDGDLDLAVANRDSNSASVLMNDGAGNFTVSTFLVGGETRDTELADFDGDGDVDLAVSDHDGRSIEIFDNAAGGFAFSTSLAVSPLVRPDGVAAADLDNDGDVDIATATSDQTLGINQVAVFVQGAGGFSAPIAFDTGGMNTSDIALGDLDCDGLTDAVTANADSNDLSLLQNIGGATFGAAMLEGAGTSPGRVLLADLDGDGDPDIAVPNRDSDDVSVLVNQSCAACVWDLDGTGSVGTPDFLDLLAAWGPNPGHPADFDGDGMVGTTDFLALLANWGPCP